MRCVFLHLLSVIFVSTFVVDARLTVRSVKDETLDASTEDDTVMNGATTTTSQQQQQQGLVDLVHLIPFDVQIAVSINMGIQTYEVSNIVTDWLNDAYVQQLELFGYTKEHMYAEFNSVVLFNNDDQNKQRRQIQTTSTTTLNDNLFIAKFRGGAVFSRDGVNRTRSVPENDVLVIQQNLLLDDSGLLSLLQKSTEATGLGQYVIDVNAFLNPPENNTNSNDNQSTNSSSSLDVVIIVAIVVALIAFLFLLGAIIWAYRFDRSNRDAYLIKDHPSTSNLKNLNDKTTSESDTGDDVESPERERAQTVPIESNGKSNTKATSRNISQNDNIIMYPTMIGVNDDSGEHDENYPESVISDSVVSGSAISEDISTSLSQYYRAGMGKADYGRSNGMLSDAGSVSSMESYGYSLDGGVAAMTIPTEIPYQRERERIGGLPVEPETVVGSRDGSGFDERSMDDVQIPDLDKELKNLDIKLLPPDLHDDTHENYLHNDLENYQMEDLKDMDQLSQGKRGGIPTFVSTTSSSSSKASSSKTNNSKKTIPIDMDNMSDTPDDENDDDILPKLPTTSVA